MKARILVWLLCGAPAMAAAQASPSILGQWSNYINVGVSSSPDGMCVTRQMEERRYLIQPGAGGGFTGVYANTRHIRWIRRTRPDCRVGTLKPENLYIELRTWGLEFEGNTNGRHRVRAVFHKCWGLPCDGTTKRSDFVTTLGMQNGELLDFVQDEPHLPPMRFRPLLANIEQATSIANAFMKRWRVALNQANGVAAGTALFDASVREDGWLPTALRDYMAARLEKSARYVVVEAYPLAGGGGPGQQPPMLHFTVRHYLTTGENVGETYELVQRDGEWRLLGFVF